MRPSAPTSRSTAAPQWGNGSRLPFHVTSRDWQESDQLLAGIITDFGSPKRPVLFGGRGQFDGTMTGAFRSPRIEGTFTGQGMRAFDTLWGDGSARIVVEDSYVNVTDGVVRHGDSEIRADGRFALGYPRDDGGEEINTRMRLTRRDIDSLRHALGIDDYPVSGLVSGEFHLTGRYERPIGFGAMSIDDGVAYKEPFEKMSASVRFDGAGVRLDNLTLAKDTGTVTGAAFVGWDSTYSFNADGRRIPVDHLAFLTTSSAAADRRRRVHRQRERHVRSTAQRRQVPRRRLRGRGRERRPGHRHAGAARQGVEWRGECGVAAAGDHRHRPHRADAEGRRRDHLPLS